jgi:hypothetical protein
VTCSPARNTCCSLLQSIDTQFGFSCLFSFFLSFDNSQFFLTLFLLFYSFSRFTLSPIYHLSFFLSLPCPFLSSCFSTEFALVPSGTSQFLCVISPLSSSLFFLLCCHVASTHLLHSASLLSFFSTC